MHLLKEQVRPQDRALSAVPMVPGGELWRGRLDDGRGSVLESTSPSEDNHRPFYFVGIEGVSAGESALSCQLSQLHPIGRLIIT